MKNRYKIKVMIAKEDGAINNSIVFSETLEQAQAAAFILQMTSASAGRAYTIKIIDTKTNETKYNYEG